MTPASEASAEPRAGAVLTIDLDAVARNWRQLAARAAPARCAAVVKADGYGLGAVKVAPRLFQAGARVFFVAHLEEAVALRAVLPGEAVIGVLNGLIAAHASVYLAHDFVPVLNHLGEIAAWRDEAGKAGRALPAYIQVDTGMNRLGLDSRETARLIAEPARLAGIDVRAWISHLACADQAGHPMTAVQRTRFAGIVARLPPAPASLANSSGIFRGSDLHFDLVRPGCALYGVNPTPEAGNPMASVIALDARILQVREAPAGGSVGYGAAHALARDARIATLALGYADGYLRTGSGRGFVTIAGHKAPIVGRVSMDLLTVDVTDLPEPLCRPGGWARVIGPDRGVDQVAADAGTIGYEILTDLGARYQRRYTPIG
ncbi:MAG: alanine racemase [Azospirillaceae bacterium]